MQSASDLSTRPCDLNAVMRAPHPVNKFSHPQAAYGIQDCHICWPCGCSKIKEILGRQLIENNICASEGFHILSARWLVIWSSERCEGKLLCTNPSLNLYRILFKCRSMCNDYILASWSHYMSVPQKRSELTQTTGMPPHTFPHTVHNIKSQRLPVRTCTWYQVRQDLPTELG